MQYRGPSLYVGAHQPRYRVERRLGGRRSSSLRGKEVARWEFPGRTSRT